MADKTPKKIQRKTVSKLMVFLPVAIILGLATVITFYIATPKLSYSVKIHSINSQFQDTQEEIRKTRAAIREKPGDAKLHRILESHLKKATALREELDSYGLLGEYWLKLTMRDGSINPKVLHVILGVFFMVIWYAFLIFLFSVVPGLGPRKVIKVIHDNDVFLLRRRAMLEKKYKQTGIVDTVRAENETLSAIDESEATLCLMPVQVGEWIMPILGFIGTVLGISMAIGSLQMGIRKVFAEGQLTADALDSFNAGFSGLGVAFDTTFLGLVGLTIAGLLAFVIRRRALAAIHAIDTRCDEWILNLKDTSVVQWKETKEHIDRSKKFMEELKKLIDETISKVGPELEGLKKWLVEEFKPGLKKEFEQNEVFRAWVTQELPRVISRETTKIPPPIVKPLKVLIGRVNTYSEIIVRLVAANVKNIHFLRRLHSFVLSCVMEGAKELADQPFWDEFLKAIIKPIIDVPEMTLIREASGRKVDCLAMSAPPYKLAIATRDPKTGSNTIDIQSVDITIGEDVVFHPSSIGNDEAVGADVAALAFNPSGNRLAYFLEDGRLGVYNLQSGQADEIILDEGHLRERNSICWWQIGGESVLVPLWRDQVTQLIRVPIEYAQLCEDGKSSIQLLEMFTCHAIAITQRPPRVILAGVNTEGLSIIQLSQWREGQFRHCEETPIHVTWSDKPKVHYLSLFGQDESMALCGLSNGAIIGVSLENPNSQRVLRTNGYGPVILADTDDSGNFLAVGFAGAISINLHSSDVIEMIDEKHAIREVRGHGPFSTAALAPNRRVLAIGGQDGHVAVWEFPVYVVA